MVNESLKLLQESHVIFHEQPDVIDPIFAHRNSLDAETESPAAVDLGVDIACGEDIGVDHSAAA
jgi:hypothetical protein